MITIFIRVLVIFLYVMLPLWKIPIVMLRLWQVPHVVQVLADHGRTAHRLHEQWRAECKKASANGQKPPSLPKKASSGRVDEKKKNDKDGSRISSDSSDVERKVMTDNDGMMKGDEGAQTATLLRGR